MLRGHLRQVVDRLLRIGERNRVSQPLAAGKHREHAPFVLGQQVAGQLRVGQPGALEVEIVEDGVFDAGVDQVAGERLLPNPLGNPKAADRGAQAILQKPGVAADLADAIPRGNHRQNRLVICPAENLDPPLLDELGQPVDVLGLVRAEPLHQRAADVQRHLQRGIAAENVEEVAIAIVERPLKNVVEVADRLMVVQGEDKTDAVGHDCFGRRV